MCDRGSDRIFYQGVVRLCQHAGTDLDPELRRGQRQHFAIDLLLGYPANLILTWNNRRRLDPKAWLLPFAALGLFAGMKCSRVLDEKWVRRLTSVLLVLSGVSLIAVNL